MQKKQAQLRKLKSQIQDQNEKKLIEAVDMQEVGMNSEEAAHQIVSELYEEALDLNQDLNSKII